MKRELSLKISLDEIIFFLFELGKRYWIYFVSEIDIENKTSPNIPEMIQDPFNRIDPLNINPENTEFDKKCCR